jgi:phospholipid/cholesterol/gamma-HCH transport system substrate-binding protein
MADHKEVRAGIFVVLALAILGAGTIWIVGSPMRGDRLDYEVLMHSSAGVRRGDRVRLSGMEVGRVDTVELSSGAEWPVLFRVSVDETVQLTEGSSARITSDGLLGAPYLELVAGPPEAPRLPGGSRIVGVESADLSQTLAGLGATTDRLPVLLDQTTELLSKVDREIEPLLQSLRGLLSEENVEAVSGVIAKLEPTLDDVTLRLKGLAANLESLAGELEEGLGGVPELTTEARGLITDLRGALGEDGDRLSQVFDSASATLGSAEGALSTMEINSQELDAMLRDLREAAANLRSLSQTLKERPSLLLRKPEMPARKPGEGMEE